LSRSDQRPSFSSRRRKDWGRYRRPPAEDKIRQTWVFQISAEQTLLKEARKTLEDRFEENFPKTGKIFIFKGLGEIKEFKIPGMWAFVPKISVLNPDNTNLRIVVEKVKTTVSEAFAKRVERQWAVSATRGYRKGVEKYLVPTTA